MTEIESWFIPCDILMVVGPSLVIILAIGFLIIMIFDKTCHTVPMMLVVNSCLAHIISAIVMLLLILFILDFPYALFILMSFFTNPPKYHFRIAYVFIDMSLVFVIITLFQFTDPLKASIMKQVKRRRNIVVPAIG